MATLTKTKTPVSVFTGFLGAGKTTIILTLLKALPEGYKIVLLKNEFGDNKVDSQLAKEQNVQVTEMLNGCLCCVLVGQMKRALLEIQEQIKPDRIIIECSGTAFPAPLAWQIRELKDDGIVLDAIITVVDCVNFTGYEDTSYTAKMQAKYTDLILLNKHELVSERELDIVIDHIDELNEDTPKIKCDGERGFVSPDLVFGLDSQLLEKLERDGAGSNLFVDEDHHFSEVDVVQLSSPEWISEVTCEECGSHDHDHHNHDTHKITDIKLQDTSTIQKKTSISDLHTAETLSKFLDSLDKDEVYRVKGIIRLREGEGDAAQGVGYILNWAFGRHTLTRISSDRDNEEVSLRLTVMGLGLGRWTARLKNGMGIGDGGLKLQQARARRVEK
ncbi:CobW/HypB/UreG, nucleotide-binding domain-containing protein [Cladochytrium replicatum]|nr:CobW/HypB/UreG, nucleotide-binding domain-containing protein [Cladochytrium replicatum]